MTADDQANEEGQKNEAEEMTESVNRDRRGVAYQAA